MNVGDKVRILRCDGCPKIVGKVVMIKAVVGDKVELQFGRGRPQAGRPSAFFIDDVILV